MGSKGQHKTWTIIRVEYGTINRALLYCQVYVKTMRKSMVWQRLWCIIKGLWQYRSGKLIQVVAVRLGGERAEHGADARPALRVRIARLLRHRCRTQPGPPAGHHRSQVSQSKSDTDKVRWFQLTVCNPALGEQLYRGDHPIPSWQEYRVVKLDYAPEIEVFQKLFERCYT